MSNTKAKKGMLRGAQNADLVFATGIIGILILFIVPLPPILIDIFLAISIGLASVLLLTALYSRKPLDFSVFPSILLTATLFRLALNVATTRLVLMKGPDSGTNAAGTIIQSFGEYVVGGNYAVGIIIFVILVIINFIVITKGAGRVAEVAARFTLDAMPGKQMAIDADVGAGVISEEDARDRRREITREADFYGAMDGASKFVRGDAIAGILIVIVNIIGGIIIGTIQNGMSIADAASTFILLTVGDGLVSQIPALIVSVAAGIIVTRASSGEHLGSELGEQLSSNPKAIAIAAVVMLMMAFMPGLPGMPFLTIAIAFGYCAFRLIKNENNSREEAGIKEALEIEKASEEKIESLLPMDVLELEIGYGLISIVDPDQDGELLSRINQIRRQIALDMGIIVPSIRIRDNLQLEPGGYKLLLKGVAAAEGELMIDHMLAMDPGNVVDAIPGIDTTEPAFGLPALWISKNSKEEAELSGYTVVDLPTVIATHLTEIIKNSLSELFGRQDLQDILDNFKEENPKVIEDLTPNTLPAGVILRVMQNMLAEGIPIRDLRTIFEILSEEGAKVKDPILLTEACREGLKRLISHRLATETGDIHILTLERQIEETIANSIVTSESGSELAPDPDFVQRLLSALNLDVSRALEEYSQAIVLCSPSVRYHFKRLVDRFIPNLIVLSHNEIAANVNLKSIGTVRIDDAG